MLDLLFDGPAPAAAWAAWEAALRERLAAEKVAVVPAGTPGAVPVRLRVVVEAGPGRTEAGTPFHGARARAVLEVGRGAHEFQGRAVSGTDPDALAGRALDDLLERVAQALTL